ncbi:consortin [Lepisosteus oculatus]|uniref:consortin n=1 Tax=Lepisosteus oculatus TaxID=7918 RepID=UPI0035F51AE3
MDEEETQRNEATEQADEVGDPQNDVDGPSCMSPQAPDENENRLLASPTVRHRAQEDTVNNNEPRSAGRTSSTEETNNNSTPPEPAKQKGDSSEGSRSSKDTKTKDSGGALESCTSVSADNITTGAESSGKDEGIPREPSCPPQKGWCGVLQPLLSSLQSLGEESDYTQLPQCLHQIAETCFWEKDYEKALQFIQLEKLYHEQVLSNLSAIQKQWESKWKVAASPDKKKGGEDLRGSEGEDLAALRKLCQTHQRPAVSVEKAVAVGSILKNKLITGRVATDNDKPNSRLTASTSDSVTEAVKQLVMSEGAFVSDNRSESAGHGERAMEDSIMSGHQGELSQRAGSAAAPSTRQASELIGRPCSDSLFADGAGGEGRRAQPAAAVVAAEAGELPGDVLTAAEPSQERREERGAGEKEEEPLDSAQRLDTEQQQALPGLAGPALVKCELRQHEHSSSSKEQAGDGDQSLKEKDKGAPLPPRKEARDPRSTETGDELPEPREMSELEQGEPGEVEELETEKEQRPDEDQDIQQGGNDEEEEEEEDTPEADPVSLEDLSPDSEEDTASLDTEGLSDGMSLLDDLAKRIQIEEITPAEGLVSILKRRSSLDGAQQPSQPHRQVPKRKVRFKEPDDCLDPDDVGGDSCLLLFLLCLVTVVISVGGTAFYCAFGDVESTVCTDFAQNVDFYFSQMQHGVDELKHWLSPGS